MWVLACASCVCMCVCVCVIQSQGRTMHVCVGILRRELWSFSVTSVFMRVYEHMCTNSEVCGKPMLTCSCMHTNIRAQINTACFIRTLICSSMYTTYVLNKERRDMYIVANNNVKGTSMSLKDQPWYPSHVIVSSNVCVYITTPRCSTPICSLYGLARLSLFTSPYCPSRTRHANLWATREHEL